MAGGVVITGAGMLAKALHGEARRRGVDAVLADRAACDITRPAEVDRLFATHRPAVLLNAAAYTNVNNAETHADLADAVNGHAVGTLAAAAAKYTARLVHYSSDFVFDGSQRTPYRPTDAPHPLSAYGRSKRLGETLLERHATMPYLILRTAWMFGASGHCFARTVVDRARAGKPLRVVNDQIGSPTFAGDVAVATFDLLDQNATGICHVVNAGSASWFDFATAVLRTFSLRADLLPITTRERTAAHPQDAVRPAYSVLATPGHTLRPWPDALTAMHTLDPF